MICCPVNGARVTGCDSAEPASWTLAKGALVEGQHP